MAIRVRLMNEYTVSWPLWTPDGVAQEGDLPVSEPVAAELRAWARTFNEHFDWQTGWDDAKRRDAHVAEAARLQRALQADLGETYEVVLELWEVGVR